MLPYDRYRAIRQDFGSVASFALWNDDDHRDLGLLQADDEREYGDAGLDKALGTGFVFVALNWSGSPAAATAAAPEAFGAFHYTFNDSKLASLVEAAPALRGSYITDLFKHYPNSKSAEVLEDWRGGRAHSDVEGLCREVELLGGGPTVFLLLGQAVEEIWATDVAARVGEGSRAVRITHYSAQGALGGKDAYVDRVLSELEASGVLPGEGESESSNR